MRNNHIAKFYDSITKYKVEKKPTYSIVRIMNMTKRFSPDRNEVAASLVQNHGNLLEVGVGDGYLINTLKSKVKKAYGMDISKLRIQQLKKNVELKQVELSVGNIEEKTQYKSNLFDTVSMIAVLEHVFDPHAALEEIRRILKNGGELIIEVPNIGWLYPRISLLLGRFPITSTDPGFDGGHIHYFEIHNLTKLLAEHGFAITHVSCSGLFSKFRCFYPSLLGGDLVVRAVKEKK